MFCIKTFTPKQIVTTCALKTDVKYVKDRPDFSNLGKAIFLDTQNTECIIIALQLFGNTGALFNTLFTPWP